MLLNFVRQAQINFQRTANLAPLLRQYPSKESASYSVLTFFTHWLRNTYLLSSRDSFWLYLSCCSLPGLVVYSHTCADQTKTQRKPCEDFQSSLSMKLSLLQDFTPQILVTLVSSNSILSIQFSRTQLSLPVLWPGPALWAASWGPHGDHFIFSFLSEITVLCCLFSYDFKSTISYTFPSILV